MDCKKFNPTILKNTMLKNFYCFGANWFFLFETMSVNSPFLINNSVCMNVDLDGYRWRKDDGVHLWRKILYWIETKWYEYCKEDLKLLNTNQLFCLDVIFVIFYRIVQRKKRVAGNHKYEETDCKNSVIVSTVFFLGVTL